MEITQKQTGDVYQDVIRTLSELAPASLNTAEIQDLLGEDVRRKDIYAACDKGVLEGLLDQNLQAMPPRFSYKGTAAQPVTVAQTEPVPVLAEVVTPADITPPSAPALAEALPAGALQPKQPTESLATEAVPAATVEDETAADNRPARAAGRAVRTSRADAAEKTRQPRRGKSEKLAAAIRAQVGKPKQQAGKMMLHLLQQTGEHLTVDQLRERLGLQGSNDSLFKSLRIQIDKGEIKRETGVWPQMFYATHPVRAVAAMAPSITAPVDAEPVQAGPSEGETSQVETLTAAAPLRPAVLRVRREPAPAPVAEIESETVTMAQAVTPSPAAVAAAAPASVATPAPVPSTVAAHPPRFNAQLDWDGQLHLNVNGQEAVLSADDARRLVRLVISYHGVDFLQPAGERRNG